jgi:hypothetical protein
MNTQLITVPFHGQSLLATLVNDIPHVALKPICENLGVDWEGQRQRISKHPVLSSTACMIKAIAEDGKLREMLMLPVKFINGWLFGIDSNRVKPEIQDRLVEYQTECFEVLANHFMVEKEPALPNFLRPTTTPMAFLEVEAHSKQLHRYIDEQVKKIPLRGTMEEWERVKRRKFFKLQSQATIPGLEETPADLNHLTLEEEHEILLAIFLKKKKAEGCTADQNGKTRHRYRKEFATTGKINPMLYGTETRGRPAKNAKAGA